MAGDGEEATYEYTSTWAFAVVYTVIVGISYGFERLLHCGGELLMDKRKKALFEALQKIKEELMLLGFVSLLLTLSETRISKICISRDLTLHMLPCWKKHDNSGDNTGYCTDDSKVPLMSVKAIHDLHIFIFILAVVHVIYCILTEFIGRLKIRPWMQWNGTYQRGQQPRNIHVLKVLWVSCSYVDLKLRVDIRNARRGRNSDCI
ncbi:hypothetical protein K1719_022973 [Acacia pycnantha]|nr:hypothetical protein K1719_022973 [Acacia pycnantha]